MYFKLQGKNLSFVPLLNLVRFVDRNSSGFTPRQVSLSDVCKGDLEDGSKFICGEKKVSKGLWTELYTIMWKRNTRKMLWWSIFWIWFGGFYWKKPILFHSPSFFNLHSNFLNFTHDFYKFAIVSNFDPYKFPQKLMLYTILSRSFFSSYYYFLAFIQVFSQIVAMFDLGPFKFFPYKFTQIWMPIQFLSPIPDPTWF